MDKAYQNACANSDKQNAYLEGNEAVLRAVRTIEDMVFLRQYFDMFIVRPAPYVRRLVAEARPAAPSKSPETSEPAPAPPVESEQVELDGGRIVPPSTPARTKVVGRVDTGAFEVVIQEMSFGPEKNNFHITDDNLGVGGEKQNISTMWRLSVP